MKILLINLALFCGFYASAQSNDSLIHSQLLPRQLQEDFKEYRALLEEIHPGLYRYVSKSAMQKKLDSVETLLIKPMGYYAFYKVLGGLNASIRCAHSSILPKKNIFPFYNKTMKSFPFYLYPIQGKYFVLFNGSTNDSVKPGYQLIRINKLPIDSIAKVLKSHYWTDGNIAITKQKAMEGGMFQILYYAIIGQPTEFNLDFKDLSGNIVNINVPAQPNGITQNLFRKNKVNSRVLKFYGKNPRKKWSVEYLKDLDHVAHLKVFTFSSKESKSVETASEAMRIFMNDVVKKLNKKKVRHLIVDLRGNSGGWDIQGVELLTYLINSEKPFRYYNRLHAITNDSRFLKYSDLSKEDLSQVKEELIKEEDGSFTVSATFNEELKLHYPKPNRFKGKVYLLIDRNTASAASEFSALAKSHNIGVIVGTESGGVYEGGNGGSFVNYELPNSKFSIITPLLHYENAVVPQDARGRGTIPDYEVRFSVKDLISRNDVQLEFVKQLIKKEKK